MPDAASPVGRTIAQRYRIEERVGGGAMGDVYRARHVGLGSEVAIKIMRSTIADQTSFKERFYREAKTASRLDHPNSVRVLDFGQESDGLVYFIMEYLRGRDLRRVIEADWPMSDERIVDILSQTLAAISTAHGFGIIHRDLKPENIMLVPDEDDERRDEVKVCDFGIAKLIDARAFKSGDDVKTALTSGNALIGTPEYMSPEQARGEALDARSDLYSVGVILYYMLARKLPFAAENALGVALKHIIEEPVPPSRIASHVNPRLEAICLRAMRKDPNERPSSAKEMRADLRRVLGNLPTPAPSAGVSARELTALEESPTEDSEVPVLPVQSRRWLFVGLTVLAATAVAGGALSWTRMREKPAAVGLVPQQQASALASAAPSSWTAAPLASTAPPVLASTSAPTVARTRGHVTPRAATSAHVEAPAATADRITTPEPAPPPPTSTASAAPDYKPANAVVSRESLSAERVRREVLDRKLAEVAPQLNDCYRDALFMVGSPVGGRADIHMSIDPSGHVVAVVSAPQLPSFQRCAGRLLSSIALPADAVESGGGTAAQALKLMP
jgi:serine/threonine-protein kinase